MKLKTKIKRRIKQNFGVIIILGIITMLGVAALINIMLLKPYVDTSKVEHKPKITVLPVNIDKGIIREITMYNSLKEQTDNTPCISADGTNICKADYNVCATNAFPMNTKLYIDGLGECIVKDRMNSRFKERVDWYAGMDKDRAVKFGLQRLLVLNK